MERHTRRRDRATRIILVIVLVLVLGDVAFATADALLTAAASLLALVAVWRVLACDVLPLYHRPVRYGLVALGMLLTAPVAALILLTLVGHAVHVPCRDRLFRAMACVTPLSASCRSSAPHADELSTNRSRGGCFTAFKTTGVAD